VSLEKLHKGKRLLLKASDVYGGARRVPRGQENYLFMYRVAKVNLGCTTCQIEYEEMYVVEDGTEFKSFPIQDEGDELIDDYRMELLKEDHELYNKYLSVINRATNELKDKAIREAVEKKRSALDDVTDIDFKILGAEPVPVYDVLLGEFVPAEVDKHMHAVTEGPDKGEVVYKQKWSECSMCIFFFYMFLCQPCASTFPTICSLQSINILVILLLGAHYLVRTRTSLLVVGYGELQGWSLHRNREAMFALLVFFNLGRNCHLME
jgi:hypothetical protein